MLGGPITKGVGVGQNGTYQLVAGENKVGKKMLQKKCDRYLRIIKSVGMRLDSVYV